MQIIRVLLFSLLIAASSRTSSSKSPHSNPQKEKPTGKNDNGTQVDTTPEDRSNHHSDEDQRGEHKKEGGKLESVTHGGGQEGEDSLAPATKGPPREENDKGGSDGDSSSNSDGSSSSNGRSVFGSLLSFINGDTFDDHVNETEESFNPETGNSADGTSHEEKLTGQLLNSLKSSDMSYTLGRSSIPIGRKHKAKQCRYRYALFDQVAKKEMILERSLEEEDNDEESTSVKGEQSPLGDDPQEGEEGTRDFLNFEKEFMKREEEEVAEEEQVKEGEAHTSNYNRGGEKGKAADAVVGKGKKKGPRYKEQNVKKRKAVTQPGQGDNEDNYQVGDDAPSGETDEQDAMLINKPESIKYFFEVLTEICAIIKLGVIHRFTHVVIPLKNIIVTKTLRQIEVGLTTMLSVHRLGSHKYKDTYGLTLVALLLYLLIYLIHRYIYKREKKGKEDNASTKGNDIYVVNLLRRILYMVERRKTMTNSEEGVMQDVLYNTETLLATTNITNKENKQIYTDMIASINNLGIFTYVSTQALKSINQKSDLLISGFTGGKSLRAGEEEELEEDEGMLDVDMDLDVDLDVNALDGSAIGGSAFGGSAIGGSVIAGSAIGGSAIGGSAIGGSAIGGSAFGGSAPGVSLAGGMGVGLGKRAFPHTMRVGPPNGVGGALRGRMESPLPPGAGGHMGDDVYDLNNMQNNFGDDSLYGENSVGSKMPYNMFQQHNDAFEEGDLLAYKKATANYDFVGEGHGMNTGSAPSAVSGAHFSHLGPPQEYSKQGGGGGDFHKEDMNSRSSFSQVSKPSNQISGDEVTNEDGGKTNQGRHRGVDPPGSPPAMLYMSREHLLDGLNGLHNGVTQNGLQSGQHGTPPLAPHNTPPSVQPPPAPMFPFVHDLNKSHLHPNGDLDPTKKTSIGLNAGISEKNTDSGDTAFPVHGQLNMMKLIPPEDTMSSVTTTPKIKDDLANHVAGPEAASLSYMSPTHQVLEGTSNRNQKYLTQRKERQKIVATKSPFN
ncbi:hypothetical protein AK88_05381 [Plasmodium fragile]|uniref:Secreted ookinete protein n=1 Tax=Plasmodium fragile TaxID=5857 RepID=A0A0D9QGY5_PLAFR|nr:uncharacterized protein AK88_05381 [Plasmodium fragile]KJP84986.1 hypothetical protein AK88_05381 [Plasmodium fragile]